MDKEQQPPKPAWFYEDRFALDILEHFISRKRSGSLALKHAKSVDQLEDILSSIESREDYLERKLWRLSAFGGYCYADDLAVFYKARFAQWRALAWQTTIRKLAQQLFPECDPLSLTPEQNNAVTAALLTESNKL